MPGLGQRVPGSGEGVDEAVWGGFEGGCQGGGDGAVPQEGEADAAPFPQGEELLPAAVCEAVGAADDEVSDVVGEDPGGGGVPGGALGVGPRPVRFSALGESFAQGIEKVVGEGGGCSVGGAGVDGQASEARVMCVVSGGCPVGGVVVVDDDCDAWGTAGCHYMPPILL